MHRTFRWIVLVLLAAPTPAFAQLTGSNTSSVGGNSIDNSSGVSGGSASVPSNGTPLNTQAFTAPVISGLDTSAGLSTGSLNQSNILGGYYANPYYSGRAGATVATLPGGFGATLYPGVGGIPANSNVFSAAAGSGPVSSATGFGGNVGTSAFGGGNTTNRNNSIGGGNTGNRTGNQAQVGGVIVPLTVPIAFPTRVMFATAPITAPQVASEVRAMLDRTDSIASPGLIDVFTDGRVVVLRGAVASEQEAQTAEGMVRLTPGVRDVRNELKVPAALPAPTATP